MSQAMRQLGGARTIRQKLEANIGAHLLVVAGVAADGVALPGGADALVLGATRESGLNGEYRDVIVGGDNPIVPLTASAAISRGARVSCAGASGKIKAAAPAAGVNSYVVGIAMEAAAADGDVIGVLWMPHTMQGA